MYSTCMPIFSKIVPRVFNVHMQKVPLLREYFCTKSLQISIEPVSHQFIEVALPSSLLSLELQKHRIFVTVRLKY